MTRTEADLVRAYRLINPRSRAVGILRYTINTSATKQQECILCGEKGPTWSARWPKTIKATDWARAHIEKHLTKTEQT